MPKRVKVTKETSTGLNTNFEDNFTGKKMTRGEFVKEINKGNYPNHHVVKIGGKNIPKTNPDGTKNNNLG